MDICYLCNKQLDKSKHGSPHEYLQVLGEHRNCMGNNATEYEEQDYQCSTCKAKFTFSTVTINSAWTLWAE